VDTFGNVYGGDIYKNRIQKFDASGIFLGKGSADAQATRLALDSSGRIYVSTGGTVVRIFNTTPTVTPQHATSYFDTQAKFNGLIAFDGGSTVTNRGFIYGTGGSYGATTTDSGNYSVGMYTTEVTSLTCNTTYSYKPFASSTVGLSYGTSTSFTTDTCPSSNMGGSSSSRRSLPVFSAPVPSVQPIQIASSSNQIPSKAAVPVSFGVFTRPLRKGSVGADVRALQKFLNANGFTVAQTGPGSVGNETTLFGAATQTALQKFQCYVDIVCVGTPSTTGYGSLGPRTREKMTETRE
jgi:hypothetical protein